MTSNPQESPALHKVGTALRFPVYTHSVKLWSNTEVDTPIVTIVAPLMRTNSLATLRKVWKLQNPKSSHFPIEILESKFCCTFEAWAEANPMLKKELFDEQQTKAPTATART